ncbi:cation diffusion facilitator family transporter [Mycobacterium tuberculosis T85]|nr:cation diffusion facilitator family transporter [Mycobacterium tuberculosis T85]
MLGGRTRPIWPAVTKGLRPMTHDHAHSRGVPAMIKEIFAPHSHDAADSVDDTLESTAAGIRTVKISLLVLG